MAFRFEPLPIPDVLLVHPTRHVDPRGYFEETYRRSAFEQAGIAAEFVQDNFARSSKNVLRGLHYQLPPAAQAKLVGVAAGRIFDVAVDLRAGSPTFGRWVGCTLDAEKRALLWIPEGFAHGYVVLSETADVVYKVTAEYSAQLDRGVRWNDPAIGIEWPVRDPIVSERDRAQPMLEAAERAFR
jgi:dTDP-4-dehydrorhamnose 3,5-epimerase